MKIMNNHYELVNLSYLKKLSGDDLKFQKELVGIFLKQIPDFISNIHEYLNNNDNIRLSREAHTAKSSVLIFMMEETGQLLKQIQLMASEDKTDKIPSLLEQVERDMEAASQELTTFINSG